MLEKQGVVDDTLVVFASDNGPFWRQENVAQTGHAAAGPWRGMKGDAWEDGHRPPLVVRWPGRAPAGAVSAALVSLTDLTATVAAALDLPRDDGARDARGALPRDGVDFSAALRGERWTRPELTAQFRRRLEQILTVEP